VNRGTPSPGEHVFDAELAGAPDGEQAFQIRAFSIVSAVLFRFAWDASPFANDTVDAVLVLCGERFGLDPSA